MEFVIYRAQEEQLIKGCMRRERSAQKSLYERYSAKMFALCYRYVKDSMDAEDVLVTAFTKIFDRIDQYKGEGSFEVWMRRVVVNEALTFLRRNRTMYLQTDLEVADREPGTFADHLEAEDLIRLIQELPSGYRVVFNMYAIDGYSHKEIADHLGISENTSKSQLSRARTYLQKVLADSTARLKNNQRHEAAH
jgi:RNA polymerase sigma-70 factor (ECF subfamily)